MKYDEHLYIDEVGGVHDSGCGYDPFGIYCGECSNFTCFKCIVWEKRKNNSSWAIITKDKCKADRIFAQVTEELKKENIDIFKFHESKDAAEILYSNGTVLRWIKPTAFPCKSFKIYRLWCDTNIDKNLLKQVIIPMLHYTYFSNIVWI